MYNYLIKIKFIKNNNDSTNRPLFNLLEFLIEKNWQNGIRYWYAKWIKILFKNNMNKNNLNKNIIFLLNLTLKIFLKFFFKSFYLRWLSPLLYYYFFYNIFDLFIRFLL